MTGILQPIIPSVSLSITHWFNAVADERGFIHVADVDVALSKDW